MPLFRRTSKREAKSAAKQITTPEPTTSAPTRVLIPPPIPATSFVSEHRDLDEVELKLQLLQERQEARTHDEITPSTGRVDAVDLRKLIDLTEDNDFDARFDAFANHAADLRARGWIE